MIESVILQSLLLLNILIRHTVLLCCFNLTTIFILLFQVIFPRAVFLHPFLQSSNLLSPGN